MVASAWLPQDAAEICDPTKVAATLCLEFRGEPDPLRIADHVELTSSA
jgi:hypothetical protein